MAHTMHVIDQSGDTVLTWEPGTATAAEVEAEFNRLVKDQGYWAFSVTDAGAEVTRKFDETYPQVIVQPQMVGG